MADSCGSCFKITGTSNIEGHSDTNTIVVKATNYCPAANPSCSGDKKHFDIAAPGFDYPAESLSVSCDDYYGDSEPALLSPQTCAYWMIDSQDPEDTETCDCDALNDDVLRAGCKNFKSLYWSNPTVDYEVVTCPDELTELPCWEDNGSSWPSTAPDLCAAPQV